MKDRKREKNEQRIGSNDNRGNEQEIKQKRIVQNTPDGVKYLNEISITRNNGK